MKIHVDPGGAAAKMACIDLRNTDLPCYLQSSKSQKPSHHLSWPCDVALLDVDDNGTGAICSHYKIGCS
jgi:uncharacterized protein YbbC (DUF1343 family)